MICLHLMEWHCISGQEEVIFEIVLICLLKEAFLHYCSGKRILVYAATEMLLSIWEYA